MKTNFSEQVSKTLLSSLGAQAKNPWVEKANAQLAMYGYDPEEAYVKAVADAIQNGNAEIVSRRTGGIWINHGLPDVPPGFIRPGRLSVGDQVHVIHWIPLGLRGASINTNPKIGKVCKIRIVRCKIAKGPADYERWPENDYQTSDEQRVFALGIRGEKGVEACLLKDYSLVLRVDGPTALPSGESRLYVP